MPLRSGSYVYLDLNLITLTQLRYPPRKHRFPVFHWRHCRLPRLATPAVRNAAVEPVSHLLCHANRVACSPGSYLSRLARCAAEHAIFVEWRARGREQVERAIPFGCQFRGWRHQYAVSGTENDQRHEGEEASG